MAETTKAQVPIFRLEAAASASLLELAAHDRPGMLSLQSALQAVGVLSPDQRLEAYKDLSAWRRGGAETYVSDFLVTFSARTGLETLHIVAKAIVSWGTPPERTAQEWMRRQRRLEEFGAGTAKILGSAAGIVYQKFIPFAFTEWFATLDPSVRPQQVYELSELAARVDKAGFTPVEFISSIRSDGVQLFIVDLGSDLGGFQIEKTTSATSGLVNKWLRTNWATVEEELPEKSDA